MRSTSAEYRARPTPASPLGSVGGGRGPEARIAAFAIIGANPEGVPPPPREREATREFRRTRGLAAMKHYTLPARARGEHDVRTFEQRLPFAVH